MSLVLTGVSKEALASLTASGAKVIRQAGDTVELTFKAKDKPKATLREDLFLVQDKEMA
jgi:hypothetical protein